MLRITGFAIGILAAVAAHADSFDDYNRWQSDNFSRMEAERVQSNIQSQLDSMRAEQSRQDQLMRSNPVGDDMRPVYVPYGGYQEPFYRGPYVGYGR